MFVSSLSPNCQVQIDFAIIETILIKQLDLINTNLWNNDHSKKNITELTKIIKQNLM